MNTKRMPPSIARKHEAADNYLASLVQLTDEEIFKSLTETYTKHIFLFTKKIYHSKLEDMAPFYIDSTSHGLVLFMQNILTSKSDNFNLIKQSFDKDGAVAIKSYDFIYMIHRSTENNRVHTPIKITTWSERGALSDRFEKDLEQLRFQFDDFKVLSIDEFNEFIDSVLDIEISAQITMKKMQATF